MNVVIVDESGKITAVGEGEAQIIVKSKDGTEITATCKVTVRKKVVEYKIIDGADKIMIKDTDGTWLPAYDKDLVVTSDAPFDKFVSVLIDGKTVEEANYDAVSGSTVVTLHKDYLSSLSIGVHDVVIRSNDGDAHTTLTIRILKKSSSEKPYVIPKTGIE